MTIAEVLKQVRLLLRRNVALHIRQPVILILELLWPILIFLVVMAARNAVPPIAQPTCYYKAWALPSAGIVPFFQSMICNIDDCQNETEYEDIPTYPGSSVRTLVENTMPLISDKSITELVSALPKGMRLVRVAVDALSGPDLSALLGDGFPVRNLLKDSNETRDLLHRQNLTSEEIDLLFNSSIQLPQMLDIMNDRSFCDTSQDAASAIAKVFEKLRASVCSSTDDNRKEFFRQLKNQLNIKNIVQTMGLAMSELGRLDISQILESIGGLLSSVQSSDIFSTDLVQMLSNVLGQIRFDHVDTEIVPLLVNDLEPLYRESEWAGLISILKDIKLSSSEKKSDKYIGKEHEASEHENNSGSNDKMPKKPRNMHISNFQNNSSYILDTLLEFAGTGMDLARLLPQRNSSQWENALKYFTVIVELADGFTNSLKRDNSSGFVDNLANVFGATLLNVADLPIKEDEHVETTNWCDKKEISHIIKSSEMKNLQNLQDYACKIAKITHQDASDIGNKEAWQKTAERIRKMFSQENIMQIQNNVLNWNSEIKLQSRATDAISTSDIALKSENIEDFVTSAECSIQGFREILGQVDSHLNLTLEDSSEIPARQADGNKEKLVLSYIFGAKNIINDLKQFLFMNKGDAGSILETLNKMLSDIADHDEGNNTSATMDMLRFLPRLAAMIRHFNNSNVQYFGVPHLVSSFLQDLEPVIWKSITPAEVRNFSFKDDKINFCITNEELSNDQMFFNPLLCTSKNSSVRLSLPKRMKQVNPTLLFSSSTNLSKFDTQTFSRVLLELTSGSGFALKALRQFLKPINGCRIACNSEDSMLKKMCLLARLQNIKNAIEESNASEERGMSNNNYDILKQLHPLLGVNEEIAEAYRNFMETVQSSAHNNYTDSEDIVNLIVSGVRLLESFERGENKMRPVLHVANSLISLLRNRVADAALYNSTSVVEIQNVFPGSPLTQDVVKSLMPFLPEITSTFFWTALAPGEFIHLISESERNISVIMSKLCNSSMTKYLYNPGLDDSILDNVGRILCRHRYYDVFEEVFQDPDIQEIVFEADNTDEIPWDDMLENLQDIISLLNHLSKARKADLSIIPALPKWQMMALDIYSHTRNPAVILYILNNKLFLDFCYSLPQNTTSDLESLIPVSNRTALYEELCKMSKQSFASQIVRNLNESIYGSLKTSPMGPNAIGLSIIKQHFWEALLNVPEIKNVVKLILGLDVGDIIEHEMAGSVNLRQGKRRFSNTFVNKLLNATERVFNMVDNLAEKKLSPVFFGSLIPELVRDFSIFIEESDGIIDLNSLVGKGKDLEKFFRGFLQEDMEKRRLDSYVKVLSNFFSKKKNANNLKNKCNALKYGGDMKASDSSIMALCSISPKDWTVENIAKSTSLSQAAKQIDEFLDDATRNKTKKIFIEKRKAEFLDSLNRTLLSGIQIPDWSSLQNPSFYFSLLRSYVRNLDNVKTDMSLNLTKGSCLTENAKIAFQESIHKLLNAIPDSEFLTCGLLKKNLSSSYSWFSKSSNLKSTIEKVSQERNNNECTHSWSWLLKPIDDIEDFYVKLSKGLPDESTARIKQCLANFTHTPLIQSLQAHANILKQATKILAGLAAPVSQWKEAREGISKKISQHLPVFLKLADIMNNDSSWFLSFAPSRIRTLKESSINLNWLLRHGFSSSALKRQICRDNAYGSVESVFVYPPRFGTFVRFKAKEFLCRNGTIEGILENVDHDYIRKTVLERQEKEFFSGKWLQKLVSSSDVLLKIAERLGASLKEVQLHDIYNIFHLFTKTQVLKNLAESMETLIQVLEPVFTGSSLIDTLYQVMDGLKAFRSLTQLANFTFVYSAKEVFGDSARDVLLRELRIDPEEVSAILNTQIDLKQAIIGKDDGKASFCYTKNDSSPICFLSSHKMTSVSKEYLQDLVLQRFLYSFGTLGIEGVLKEAHVDADEAGRTLEVLSSAPLVVSRLTNHLETVTTAMHPEIKELFAKLNGGAEWLATSEALSIGGQILCGKPLSSLNKKFSLLAPEDTENKIEEKELLRLPTDFCRYGYREIMKMRGGAILWGFLKPLFRGKILYAPKDYSPGLTIIAKVNETLKALENQIKFVRAAAEGSTGLHYVQRKGETLLSLQKFLASKSVSKLLGSPSWGSALSWLESSNTNTRSLLTLVELVGNVSECISLDRFLGFDTEAELEAAAATLHDRREFIAAIVFLNNDRSKSGLNKRWANKNDDTLPPRISYKIRMDIDNVPTSEYIKYRWWRPYPYDDFFEDLRYFRGFIQLQDTIDNAITSLQTKSETGNTVRKYLQQFPYPCHQRDKFGTLLKGSMPAVMTISWVFIVAFLVRERVLDRELELDETLRVMGLKQSAGWLAWFLTGLVILLVSVVGIVIVLKWGGITPYSNPAILFIFVAEFALLLISYCQLMSTFYTRATTAALMSVLVYILSFFPFLLFVTWELDFLYWQKLLSCILIATSFCFGCLYLNRYEDQGQGVQWSNMWQSPVAEDRMNFGTTLITMALCSLLYFMISWYITKVCNGNAKKKPWTWYLLSPSSIDKKNGDGMEDLKMKSNSRDLSSRMDAAIPSKNVGISMKNIHALYSKRGSKEWKALCGINLDFYEEHITALLGHNGAGKTTTLKILTGRLRPTAGSVTVAGYNFPEQISEARKNIGFCPQNNTLYDKLTVKEHLYLFAQLKNLLTPEEVEEDVQKMLQSLNLVEKQSEPSETLSGGQRRRLCVGIAFIGGSKVVILDEPTSSVDPVARRGIWDLILSYKKGRTILLTTHHLDEADILSDRVAILHKGRLLCCGSPLYLKCRFGSGYRLSLFHGADKSEDRDSGHDSASIKSEESPIVDCDGVMDFIQTYVPDAALLENDDSHLVISLPFEPLSLKPLSAFFAHLEKSIQCWGFQTFSLSSATLDEVFLTLCRLEDAKAAHHSEKFSELSSFSLKRNNAPSSSGSKTAECHKDHLNALTIDIHGKEDPSTTSFRGLRLKCSQLISLIKKRYWHTKRNWKTLTSSIIMPCIFIALAMGLSIWRPQKKPDPSIELKPSLYSTYDNKAVSFFAWYDEEPNIGYTLLKSMNANFTHGRMCLHDHSKCYIGTTKRLNSKTTNSVGSRCLCETECDVTTPMQSLPFLETQNQLIYNLSNINIPKYLLDSYLQYNEKRYGGWSMRNNNNNSDPDIKVWFENSGYHSAPSYLNALNNAVLKNASNQNLGIRTWSHPLRLSVEQLGRETLLQRLGEVGIAFVFLIGLSLVPSTFAVYVVGERESEQKRLQMVTGHVGPLMYWGAAFLWDLAIVLTTSVLSAVIVAGFALPAFYDRENFRAVYSLVFLYGWATTPLTYFISRFFREGSLAFMVIFSSHLFVGLVIMLALVSLRMINVSKDVAVTLDLLQRISLAFPQYSLVSGLTDLNENQIRTEIFAQFGQNVYVSPFSWNSLGPNFVALFFQGVIFFLLTVIFERIPPRYWLQRLIFKHDSSPVEVGAITENTENSLLQVQNVSQVYRSKSGNKYALNNLSLHIPEGECFGLVGANGAGKTTLFRILIGEEQPVTGKIHCVGLQTKTIPKHRFLGYCPQKDALDDLLTPRQHLEVYSGLRGISSAHINKVVDRSLQSLELNTHADFPVSSLSGGTKRKLCTAIANLGDPELILLDEPTSGMDPGTRRLVWRNISRATEAGRSVVLTSHSIEDCDVLCTRLGIVVNGKIACLDSPHKLKARLGNGYTMSFRIPEGKDWQSVLNFIHKVMPFAQLQVRSGKRIEMSLPDETITLSNLFCHLEECAEQFDIEDLAIDPTTLDQVFVTFVRQQSDATQRHEEDSKLEIPLANEDVNCTKL